MVFLGERSLDPERDGKAGRCGKIVCVYIMNKRGGAALHGCPVHACRPRNGGVWEEAGIAGNTVLEPYVQLSIRRGCAIKVYEEPQRRGRCDRVVGGVIFWQ